jgi:acid stress-induced BolA-like protein IbaG/YrbA
MDNCEVALEVISDVSRLTSHHNIYNCVGTIIMTNSVHFHLMFTYFTEASLMIS